MNHVVNATLAINVINATDIYNVTDGINLVNVTHSLNLTNATDTEYASDNYNCTGKTCQLPRIYDERLKNIIEEKIEKHSQVIIDRLYDLYTIGNVKAYENQNIFDEHVFKANSD